MILLATLFFSLTDTSAKWLVMAGLPAVQVAFARYLGAFVCALMDGAVRGQVLQRTERRDVGLVILRGAILIASTVFNFIALNYLPLVVTASIMNSAPIILTALAVPLLGERVGPFRWAAVIAGFLGVLIVIRPFGAEFHWAAILSLGNAVAIAFFAILTRMLSGRVPTQTMQLYVGAMGSVVLLPLAVLGWQTPETSLQWALILGIGVVAWTGHEIFSRAHAFAEASVLIPFQYSGIVYMTFAGILVFGTTPDALTLVGAAVIVGSGLVIWWREILRKGRAARLPDGQGAAIGDGKGGGGENGGL